MSRNELVCECGHLRKDHQYWCEGEPDDCFGGDGHCDCGKFWDAVHKLDYEESRRF